MIDHFWLSLTVLATLQHRSLPAQLAEPSYLISTYTAQPDNTEFVQKFIMAPQPRLEVMPQAIDFDTGPVLQSEVAAVMDESTGAILWEKDAHSLHPLASMTKLVTALTALDYIDNWKDSYAMQSDENGLIGARLAAGTGDMFTKKDILAATMIASANNAALALARSTGLSDEDFVIAMNAKAQELGMKDSYFVEPTGLGAKNHTTAIDIAIAMRTIQEYPLVVNLMKQKEYHLQRLNGPEENRDVVVRTTNRLLKNDLPLALIGKTGFTYEAGYCMVSIGEDDQGNRVIVSLMGGPDETIRFDENYELIEWAFAHYKWDK